MKTFSEFYQDQSNNVAIEQLARGLSQRGIDAPTAIADIVESLMVHAKDDETRQELALIEQKVIEAWAGATGNAIGNAAGQFVRGVGNFLGGIRQGATAGYGQTNRPTPPPIPTANALKMLLTQIGTVKDPQIKAQLQTLYNNANQLFSQDAQQQVAQQPVAGATPVTGP
jgi:hypothetical protein